MSYGEVRDENKPRSLLSRAFFPQCREDQRMSRQPKRDFDVNILSFESSTGNALPFYRKIGMGLAEQYAIKHEKRGINK